MRCFIPMIQNLRTEQSRNEVTLLLQIMPDSTTTERTHPNRFALFLS